LSFQLSVTALLPDFNDHIRTHFSTEGASSAVLLLANTGHGKTLVIHLVTDDNTFFGAGQDTQSTAFAPFFLENNLWHSKSLFSKNKS
jgi:hypothetical protein